jgi:hypothetical protein
MLMVLDGLFTDIDVLRFAQKCAFGKQKKSGRSEDQ